MPPIFQAILPSLIVTLALAAFLGVWTVIIDRWRRGIPLIPYTPRRPVPWSGIHLLLVIGFYLAIIFLATLGVRFALGPEIARHPPIQPAEQASTEHIVAKLLDDMSPLTLVLTALSAIIVAPVVEEFFFRVLLQGWLEKVEVRLRPQMPTFRRYLPRAAGPIFLTSFLFGRMHFRINEPAVQSDYLVYMVAADTVAKVLTLAFAVVFLRVNAGATSADLGWAPQKTLSDVGLGLKVYVATIPLLYLFMLGLGRMLPPYVAPDPIALFFLALVLGTIYYRAQRLMPVVFVHAALNATSWVLLVVLKVLHA